MKLTIKLIGEINFYVDKNLITHRLSDKSKGILAYLVVNNKEHYRRNIANIFWNDFTTESANRNLRHSLWNIRKESKTINDSFDIFETPSKSTIQINPKIKIQCDLINFKESISHSLNTNEEYHDFTKNYHGELIENFYIEDAQAFNNWVYYERRSFEKEYCTYLYQQGKSSFQQNNLELSRNIFKDLIPINPYDEKLYKSLMQCYLKENNKAGAIATYNECKKVLREELNISPNQAIKDLYQSLKTATIDRKSLSTNSLITNAIATDQIIIHQTNNDSIIEDFKNYYMNHNNNRYIAELTKIPGRRLPYEGIFELANELLHELNESLETKPLEDIIERRLEKINEYSLFIDVEKFFKHHLNTKVQVVIYNLSHIDEKTIDLISFLYRNNGLRKIQFIICYNTQWSTNRIKFFIDALKNEEHVKIIKY